MGVKIGFIKGVKNLTPKIFHLSVSHRKFLANLGVFALISAINLLKCMILPAPSVTAGIRCDVSNNDSTACAQPREKEIYDFVFERGKGTAVKEKLYITPIKKHTIACA